MKIAGLFLVCVAIYVLRLDDVAGMMVDDAWYLVLAKALASGDGYRLISSATTPIVPSVPPLFPLLLAPVFVFSDFPNNLVMLKLLSCLAMAGVGVAYWLDLTRNRGVSTDDALWLTGAAVLTPAVVFLATSTVMAECVFMLAQMCGVLAVERAVRHDDTRGAAVVAGVLAAAVLLIRTAGVALVVASAIYFIIRRRRSQAAVFIATVAVCLTPWIIYSRLNTPTFEDRFVHGGTIAYSYTQLISQARPGGMGIELPVGAMAARAGNNVIDMVTRDIGATIVPALYRGAAESGEEVVSVGRPGRGSMGGATGTMIVSTVIALLVVIGTVKAGAWLTLPVLLIGSSMAMISLVGAQTFRYVVPLTPFLLWLLWRGVSAASPARIAVLVVLGFHLVDHVGYLQAKRSGLPPWIIDARRSDDVLAWIASNVSGSDAIASTNPALVYLRTGRKGVASAFPDQSWDAWKAAGVRYVAALRRTEPPPRALGGRMVYESASRLWILEM